MYLIVGLFQVIFPNSLMIKYFDINEVGENKASGS